MKAKAIIKVLRNIKLKLVNLIGVSIGGGGGGGGHSGPKGHFLCNCNKVSVK